MKQEKTQTEKAPRAGRKICMLVYSFYESDNRVMRYARALAERGDQVDVIALADGNQQPAFEVIDGVMSITFNGESETRRDKYTYLYRLLKFCVKSSFVLSRLHLKHRYDLVHVHNVPDFLVYSAWLPRLTGARMILDIHDMLPEFFANKFGKPERSLYVRLLKLIERLSARFANHVIISNHLWSEKATARSMSREKCSVFINYVDLNLFRSRRTRNDGRFIMLYHGGLQRHQGLDLAIRAFDKVCRQNPGTEFHIYGGGNMKPELQALVQKLGLHDRVFLQRQRTGPRSGRHRRERRFGNRCQARGFFRQRGVQHQNHGIHGGGRAGDRFQNQGGQFLF